MIAYDNWKNNKIDDVTLISELRNIYTQNNNKVKSLINKSKKNSFASNLSKIKSNKDKWNLISNQGCLKDSSISDEEILNNFELNSLNKHFASIHSSKGANLETFIDVGHNDLIFEFREISEENLLKALNQIKSNAIGNDGIPLKFLKLIIRDILKEILFIFNFCIKENVYPENWNSILIKPLNKIPNPENSSDFRPICIINVLAKLFAILINDQIVEYIEINSILHDHQSGFRKQFSCTTALLKISEIIRESLSKNN